MKSYSINLPAGYASREVASFVAQLDNLSERMYRDTRGLSTEDLAWQSAPGMNSIGMLLAHNAIVEVYWINRLVLDAANQTEEAADAAILATLGIEGDADGLPLAEIGTPPAGLTKDLSFFDNLASTARAYLSKSMIALTDEDMEREFRFPGKSEDVSITPRWTLYHILEHQAGHYGQILLVKHQLRLSKAVAA